MICSKCNSDNPNKAKFCIECGSPIEFNCPNCGEETSPAGKFCMACGFSIESNKSAPSKELTFDEKLDKIQRYLPKGITNKILSQRGKIEGERQQVTVLFCDMVGFTALSERLGPDDAYTIMDQVYEILIHKIHDYEGTVNEMTGDGIMALFGAPIALEDAPQRAIHSALAINQEITKFNDQIKRENTEIQKINMRIGIHTGPVVVGTLGNDLRVEFKAVGDTVNTASRMEGLAEPGTVYISEATFQFAEGLFQFEALGKQEVKGKEKPIQVYRVIGTSSRRTRFDVSAERGLTPLIGRERELELLIDGFERSKAGRGQALSIMGEAGLGKSRLLYEFRKTVANEDITFLEGKCLSYSRNVAYHPVIDVLKSNFLISESDNDADIVEKVKNDLKALKENESLALPYLLELLSVKNSGVPELSLSPEILKGRIIETLIRILIKGSEIKPLIIAIEDLHWVDNSSEESFKSLLNTISGARIFVIFTYRPEFVHTWGPKSYHGQVNLNRLSNRQSLEMAKHLLGDAKIDLNFEDMILEKTEGVPFFVEEFIKSMLSIEAIQNIDNVFHFVGNHQELSIPVTIHDVIMARVDTLPEGAKELLQTGSAIEREFSYEMIKAIMNIPEQELLTHLSALKDFELIYERGIYPQSVYVFKHALTQEIAYSSLINKRRKNIHNKIASAIEELYAERIEEFYEKLAHHYTESENFDRARKYLKLSGDKALELFSNSEAYRFYKKLIQVIERLPKNESNRKDQIKTILSMFYPMRMLAFPEGSLQILEKGVQLSKELRDTKSLTTIYSLIGKMHTFKGNPLMVRKYQEKSLQEALKAKDIDIIAPIANDLMFPYILAGEHYKIVEMVPKVIELLEKTNKTTEFYSRTTNAYSDFLTALGTNMGILGNFKDGEPLIKKGLKHAQQLGHMYSIGWAEYMNGSFYLTKGEGKKCIEYTQKAIDYFKKSKANVYLGMELVQLGNGYFLNGELEKAIEAVQDGFKFQKNLGTPTWMSYFYWSLGCINWSNNDLVTARKDLSKAMTLSHENGEKHTEGLASIWLGRVLGAMNKSQFVDSEQYILRGIDILVTMKLKPSYSQGYLFLGELYNNSDETEKASEYLEKAENYFRDMEMNYWVERTREITGNS